MNPVYGLIAFVVFLAVAYFVWTRMRALQLTTKDAILADFKKHVAGVTGNGALSTVETDLANKVRDVLGKAEVAPAPAAASLPSPATSAQAAADAVHAAVTSAAAQAAVDVATKIADHAAATMSPVVAAPPIKPDTSGLMPWQQPAIPYDASVDGPFAAFRAAHGMFRNYLSPAGFQIDQQGGEIKPDTSGFDYAKNPPYPGVWITQANPGDTIVSAPFDLPAGARLTLWEENLSAYWDSWTLNAPGLGVLSLSGTLVVPTAVKGATLSVHCKGNPNNQPTQAAGLQCSLLTAAKPAA